MEPNLSAVHDIYAAFGRGDVATVLSKLGDDVDWGFVVEADDVPWHQPVRGRANVAAFFQALGENLEITSFAPRAFATGKDVVAVEISFLCRVRRTGREVQIDQMHIWNFDGAGHVSRMRHYEDTAKVQAAWRA